MLLRAGLRGLACGTGVILSSSRTVECFRFAASPGFRLGVRASGSSSRGVPEVGAADSERAEAQAEAAMVAPESREQQIVRDLGIRSGAQCVASGELKRVGCSLGCSCSWDQTCYPRYMLIEGDTPSPHLKLDVGVCEPAMPIVITGTACLSAACLLCVVTLRMLLLGSFASRALRQADARLTGPEPLLECRPASLAPRQADAPKAPLSAWPSCDTIKSKTTMTSEEGYCSSDDALEEHRYSSSTIHSAAPPGRSSASSQAMPSPQSQQETPPPVSSRASS